ncbi:MAG: DEAD/DEAH box helicase [Bacteroidia bacterium]
MNNFEKLGLNEQIIQAITELGFENPTPVQEQAIPQLISQMKDFIGLAQTGTGKTAAFGLPLLQLLDVNSKITQALVLAPTRELCVQIANDLEKYSKYMGMVKTVAIYGGASISDQIRAIRRGAHIVVATPGRLLDMINRDVVDLSKVRFAVLDEADEMLNMGFKEEIDAILDNTPETKNTWLFSATMPQEVRDIARNYMFEPVEITMGKKNSGAENIEHIYYVVQSRDRYAALKRLVDAHPDIFAIIFCRTKLETQEVAEKMSKDGYNADSLHGDLSQAQRDKVMGRYRDKSLQILVATDVAARGIDVNDVTHVINYNLPDELENYTHRSGRTARAGKSGVSMIIISARDVSKIRQIEKMIGKKFTNGKIPSGVVVVENQLMGLIKRIHNVEVNELGITKYLPAINEELKDLSKEDLIKRVVSVEFNRFLEYYRNATDLNSEGSRREAGEGGGYSNAPKLFINLGSVDGFDKNEMVKYLVETTGMSEGDFGHINIKGVYTFIEMKEELIPAALEKFRGEIFKGRKVRTDISSGRSSSGGGGDRGGSRYGGDRGRGGYGGSSERSSRGSGGYGGGERSRSYGDRDRGGRSETASSSSYSRDRRPRSEYSKNSGSGSGSGSGSREASYDEFFKKEFSESKGFDKGEKRPRKKY